VNLLALVVRYLLNFALFSMVIWQWQCLARVQFVVMRWVMFHLLPPRTLRSRHSSNLKARMYKFVVHDAPCDFDKAQL